MHPHISHIPHISSLFAGLGLRQAVLSPGSRCGPMVVAMVRQPEIACYSVVDERSAAFIAMGMSIQSGIAAALICTSGTAGLNYSPAIAEAFYQEVPLLILTADRPREWIDKWDGQTIRQEGMYGRHVKGNFSLPEDGNIEASQAILGEAWQLAHQYPSGPVHINVPIKEPFYLKEGEEWPVLPPLEQTLPPAFVETEVPEGLWEKLQHAQRILIVAGQQDFISQEKPAKGNPSTDEDSHADQIPLFDEDSSAAPSPAARILSRSSLQYIFSQLQKLPQVTLVHDIISNGQDVEGSILGHDLFLGTLNEEEKKELQADILLTTGKSLISKNLKLFLRAFPPQEHWHIDTRNQTPDPFQTLTGTVSQKPESFFSSLLVTLAPKALSYQAAWQKHEERYQKALSAYKQEVEWSEWKAIMEVLEQVPKGSVLHLANSMAVRYVNFFGKILQGKQVSIQANRGTSGIDGSNGTAVGFALSDAGVQTLITGDLAFLYDANAFWHKYPMSNLRIVVLNNGGGGIFRMIDGPARLPELEEWFETRHERTAKELADMYHMSYQSAQNEEELAEALDALYLPSQKPVVLEIFSNPTTNKSVFQSFKQRLNT